MSQNPFTVKLIAPCGMNCGICRAYLAYIHGVPTKRGKVTHCKGCIPRAKKCYIIRGCPQLRKHLIQSCTECENMPCEHLAHLDNRYRERYGMSMVENLKEIQTKGVDAFLKSQADRYRCSSCSGVVSVHDGKCYSCGQIRDKANV
jgi:hypothetical protein